MLNLNKLLFKFHKLNIKNISSLVNETLEKPKLIKKKKLTFVRDGMIASFQLLKKDEPTNQLFHDGYVYLELKEANSKYVIIK